MKSKVTLLMIVLGGFLIVVTLLGVIQAIVHDHGPDPVGLTLGIVGGVLVWRGLVLRFPDGIRSGETRPRLGEEWTTKTGIAKPSFLKDGTPEAPPEPNYYGMTVTFLSGLRLWLDTGFPRAAT